MLSAFAIAQEAQEGKAGSNSAGQQETQPKKASDTEAKPQVGETKKAANDASAKPAPEPDDVKPTVVVPPKPVVIDLLKPPLEKTWQLFASEEGVKLSDVWKLSGSEDERLLVCTGKPKGYLRTRAIYNSYSLAFDFRFPLDENGNSGVLLHISGKDKIWPDAVQVQLHRPTAGSIFPSGNRKARFTIGAKLDLAIKKWNKCRIDVRGDTIEVILNNVAVGPLKYCDPMKGHIALQCEGSEIHFRNMKLTPIVTTELTARPTQPAVVTPEPKQPSSKAQPKAGETAATGG